MLPVRIKTTILMMFILNVLFSDSMNDPNEKLVDFAAGGLCNLCLGTLSHGEAEHVLSEAVAL